MPDKTPADSGILSGSARSYLDRVCAELARRGDHRAVIRLVDRWASAAEPSREALLAQARSLMHLRLMDRAWLRLNELSTRLPDDVEGLALTAQLFIERGWPTRARKVVLRLAELAPGHPLLASLEQGMQAPPLQPDPNAKEIERTGTPAQQLEQAERFQAVGSLLRAQSILERLRRQPGPWSPRVEDLLWGLDADFSGDPTDPMVLAGELLPGATTPPDDDRPEHTESLRVRPAEDDADLGPAPAFPALFRRMDERTAETETNEEHTAVSILADRQRALAHEPPTEEEEGPAARDGDTQIMLVVHKDGGPSSGHRLREDKGYNLRETLNLREYQASMGLRAPDPGAEEVNLEEEDEELIVVTRREADPGAPAADAERPAGPSGRGPSTGPLPPPPAGPSGRGPSTGPLPPPPAGPSGRGSEAGPGSPPRAAPSAGVSSAGVPSAGVSSAGVPSAGAAPRGARGAASPAARPAGRPAVVGTLALVAVVMVAAGLGLVFLLARFLGS